MTTEREKLIEELKKILWDDEYNNRDAWIESLADFILSDRNRILEPLVKIPNQDKTPLHEWHAFAKDAISLTLKLANGED